MTQRPTMKATQGDRAVVYESEYGERAKVRAWDNAGVLTLEITFDEDGAVAVEINGKDISLGD